MDRLSEKEVQKSDDWVFLFEKVYHPYQPRFVNTMAEEQKKKPIPVRKDGRISGMTVYRYYVNKRTNKKVSFIHEYL